MTPAEPVGWHLDRVEAVARLLREQTCRHCAAVPEVVSCFPGTDLPRALSWRHEVECPTHADDEV